ncbi:MAG: hypothetical protein HOW73_15905 [Polyangiaceae bacterium]|nr:hypothetical protein [Polyangiaceae bacterium]
MTALDRDCRGGFRTPQWGRSFLVASLAASLALVWSADARAQPAPTTAEPPAPPAPTPPPTAPAGAVTAQPDTGPVAPVPVAPRIDQSQPLPEEVPPPPPLAPEATSFAPVVTLPPTTFRDDVATDGRRMDWLFPMSLGGLALGGVLALSGGITIGAGQNDELCTITGCVDRPSRRTDNIGADLIGAGAGFALVGATGLLGWAVGAPRGDEMRRNEPMMAAGFSITSLAAASLGVGIGQALTYDQSEPDFSTAWPYFLTSGLLTGIGIPLLAVGAKKQTPADIAAREAKARAQKVPEEKAKRKSRRMIVAGAVLMGIGDLAGLAGLTTIAIDAASNGGGGLSLVVGTPLLGGGLVFNAIGIPLLVVGLKNRPSEVAPVTDTTSSYAPEVTAGPTGIRAVWRLP